MRLIPPALPRAVLALALTLPVAACGADDAAPSASRTGAPAPAPSGTAPSGTAPAEPGPINEDAEKDA